MKSEILRYFTTEVIIIYIFWHFIWWRINALSYDIVPNCFTNYKWSCAEKKKKHYDIEPKEHDIFFYFLNSSGIYNVQWLEMM